MTATSRREQLRFATRESHGALDAMASALDLSRSTDYGQFLVANAAPLAALELALEAAGVDRLVADWRARARRHALENDLAMLGLSVQPMPPPVLHSISEQLGVLYVLEGSRLGARALLHTVRRSNDSRVLASLQFLAASEHGDWPAFLRWFESVEPVDVHAMSRATCAAFDLFRDSFAMLQPRPRCLIA